jgi:hypothetical protein
LEHPVFGIGAVIYLCLNDDDSGETGCKMVMYQDASRIGDEVLTGMRPISQGRQRLWYYPKSPRPTSQALNLNSAVKKKLRMDVRDQQEGREFCLWKKR